MELFRERLLDSLVARKAISDKLVRKLLAWRYRRISVRRSRSERPPEALEKDASR